MVKDTIEAEKNSPYLECISEKNLIVKNKSEVMSALCDKFEADPLADPLIAKPCKNSNVNFCNACCHHHLGLIYMKKILNCNTECVRVTGEEIEEEIENVVHKKDDTTLGNLAI